MKSKKIIAIMLVLTLMLTPINITSTKAGVTQGQNHDIQINLGEVATKQLSVLQLSAPSLKNYKTISVGAESARKQIYNHESNFYIYIKTTEPDYNTVFNQLWGRIFKETGNSDEGDYMYWDLGKQYLTYNINYQKVGNTTTYYYAFKVQLQYRTTLNQRNQVNEKVDEIINGFNFTTETTEYEKVKAIYDYICSNVTYSQDDSDDMSYTSWSALFNGNAVCQGYAQLLYKMFLKVGISTRLIPGAVYSSSEINHGWNIVKLGNYYYNIDATWDAELLERKKSYENFLKGDNFKNHTRMGSYATTQFYAAYPMALTDYNPEVTANPSNNTQRALFSLIKPKFKSISRKKAVLKKIASASKYYIKYSTDKKFKKGNKTVSTTKLTYKFKKLKKKKTYYVKFRGYNKINGNKVYTKWSAVKKIKKKS